MGEQLGQEKRNSLAALSPLLGNILVRFNSIDEALYECSNENVVELGKLCIAYEILRAERDSILGAVMKGEQASIAQSDQTWAARFLSLALSGSRRDQIEGLFRNLTIINFNYDRVLEQYLFWSMQTNYGFPGDVAATALSPDKLKILRPYGSVGMLEWQREPNVPFGDEPRELAAIAKCLRTYTEELESANADSIKASVASGQTFIVIGFGFHKQNINILRNSAMKSPRQLFITVYSVPGENNGAIANTMMDALDSSQGPICIQ